MVANIDLALSLTEFGIIQVSSVAQLGFVVRDPDTVNAYPVTPLKSVETVITLPGNVCDACNDIGRNDRNTANEILINSFS
ncbi:hypothetical protein [Sphingobium lactosutens]|uniref:hypothetical protein n=1 Tax=Sphingobium lactosutens TaxID=522773 RepID=UPI0015B7BE1F|nr:hypothetical protein [Sphingobium lactosutens]